MPQLLLDIPPPAATRRLLLPLLISPRSCSISASLHEVSKDKLLPRPPTDCASLPPPFGLRLLLLVLVGLPLLRWLEVKGRGNGDGNSSTERECGFRNGPEVMGPDDMEEMPPAAGVAPGRGVGGGDVPPPSLLRSFRVICGRD